MPSSLLNRKPTSVASLLYDRLVRTNPEFAEFARSCEGKSPEQICDEHGLEIDDVRSMLHGRQ